MFGLGSAGMGSAPFPNSYRPSSKRKMSKKDNTPPTSKHLTYPSVEFFEPAIDGPPSPQGIRAYTEQMRRGSAFAAKSTTPSITSASSFRSRQSSLDSSNRIELQRQSSGRSNGSSMATKDRPDSLNLFGKTIFSRSSKKFRRNHTSMGGSSLSLASGSSDRDRSDASSHSPPSTSYRARKNTISGPYNFQHITHTQQNELPNLRELPPTRLVSEFSALRASQAPTNGNLKGIRARDLMFENFSSVAIDYAPDVDAPRSPTSPKSPSCPVTPQRRPVFRASVSPPQNQPWRPINYSMSHDNLRSVPVRPMRSPESPRCPVNPPARTSSRAASTFFSHVEDSTAPEFGEPLAGANTNLQESAFDFTPQTHPSPPKWERRESEVSVKHLSHAVTTPGEEAWPLSAPLSGSFGVDLADVLEEDEYTRTRSRESSTDGGELRLSKSVPGLRMRALEQAPDMPDMPPVLGRLGSIDTTRFSKRCSSIKLNLATDSWEDAIDFCYEDEGGEDWDYEFDETFEENKPAITAVPASPTQMEQVEEDVSPGRFRPSLLVPAPYDLPALSPLSNLSSASSFLPTPTNYFRPNQMRPDSHASSFKESDGFNLSPTLLIPSDEYPLQSEQDALFDTYHNDEVPSASIFPMDTYEQPASPIDEALSSTNSYRSSVYSHNSLRSSTISSRYNRSSQDSALLIFQAGSMSKAHRSIGSASSLPDLVPSLRPKRDSRTLGALATTTSDPELITKVSGLKLDDNEQPSEVTGMQSHTNQARRSSKNAQYFAQPPPPISTAVPDAASSILSPVAESFTDSPPRPRLRSALSRELYAPASVESFMSNHGRKISAPIVTEKTIQEGSRSRSSTLTNAATAGKRRGSYNLFPAPPTTLPK
ncbi:putative pak-box p21-rho-binding protein [Botrytis fragariae]|uniref:Putative pak-box p21-rho-binding protein n=1 Tax=Botrytis fragariae TaxID=1964551 RepID=A0A8H6AU76_9HELO|nr:putative pak-box p21-rho-binding protein [Botrytis fragariae]KAF5873580.1 putative pak-box p21-rho-binding protein [Botrytis fragariae]